MIEPALPAPSAAAIAAAWRLADRDAERLAWIHPFDRERLCTGEAARRLRELDRIDRLLAARLGESAIVAAWLRTPNGELHGARPLDWMAGATSRLVQIRLRLEAEAGR